MSYEKQVLELYLTTLKNIDEKLNKLYDYHETINLDTEEGEEIYNKLENLITEICSCYDIDEVKDIINNFDTAEEELAKYLIKKKKA